MGQSRVHEPPELPKLPAVRFEGNKLEARFGFLIAFNKLVRDSLSLIDVTDSSKGSIAALFSACRGLVFSTIKEPLWEMAKDSSHSSAHQQFKLYLFRMVERKRYDESRHSIFGQAFRQIDKLSSAILRIG